LVIRSIVAGTAVKPDRSGVAMKLATIGGAAASCWVIGGRPRRSSTVRSMLTVEYMLLSTAFRLT